MNSYIIYGLFDPRNKELRYIGQSRCGIKRARVHAFESVRKRHRTHTTAWIENLLRDGVIYEISVIEGGREIIDQNGHRYEGVCAAARILQLDASSISKVLRGKLKHIKNYVFRWI
jgi:hypothetical protein